MTQKYIIERRTPNSLRLEAAMMMKLADAKWPAEAIAGWIAAQRRDGLLSMSAAPWLVEAQLEMWQRVGNNKLRTECRIDEARLSMQRNLTDCQIAGCLGCPICQNEIS